MTRAFLSATWRHLLMVNYRVDPALIAHLAPVGTTVDTHEGQAFVSLVGFLFAHTRVRGLAIPFHRDFEELNLRYYIRRDQPGEARRAVAFVKEIVPLRAVAAAARLAYNENYVFAPMSHLLELESGPCTDVFAKLDEDLRGKVSYSWTEAGREHSLAATADGPLRPLAPGSHEEFIAEHYWGYAAQRDGGTVEYQVEHPPWRVRDVREVRVDVDFAAVYGPEWVECLSAPPVSAFCAEGSEVSVYEGERIA